jgi:lipoprotein-anchoring transpeptidase ErfK/SrfK
MKRAPLISTGVLVATLLAAGASLAVAENRAAGKLAAGMTVAGVPVGGLSQAEAVATLERTLGETAQRPVRVRVADERFKLGARRAGVRLDVAATVRAAYAHSREGSWPQRAWRSLAGGTVRHDQPLEIAVDRPAIDAFVARIRRAVAREPVDATVVMTVEKVGAEKEVPGRRLRRAARLAQRIEDTFTSASSQRRLRGRVAKIAPEVTAKEIWKDQPTTVTVSLAERRVRVFDRGKLEKSYTVAIGAAGYPTPPGEFTVQSMQVNPAWSVPQSDWAGDLAGQVIPGGAPGNPLVARWIGFNGSVGFHGTASISSLGGAASHGCVRMNPADVIDLYERVELGTRVLVA